MRPPHESTTAPLLPALIRLAPPIALALALMGALRGAGETKVILYAAFLGGWVVRIPLAYRLSDK